MPEIQDLQLSDNTVTRRIQDISKDMQTQLKSDLEICDWFSLQFDASTDITDIAQLKGQTTGADIYNRFRTYAKSIDVPLYKLSAISTDGAPAMLGNINGSFALCKKNKLFPNFVWYHCIIHQEVLYGRILPSGNVMKTVPKIVNFIRAAALHHRLSKALLENSGVPDLILHCEECWLSKSKTL